MIRISVRTTAGDLSTGAGFHVGDGWMVTARHVVEGGKIQEVVPHKAEPVTIHNVVTPSNDYDDIALLETDFRAGSVPGEADHIPIGGHLDDWFDDDFILWPVLLMGYPPIPQSDRPELVAVSGEVNAVVDKYLRGSPSFVVSPLARGGFSGGPIICDGDFLLGIMTETLLRDGQVPEVGFGAAVSVEPIWGLLLEHHIYPASNGLFVRVLEGDPEAERQFMAEADERRFSPPI